jgi:hypothetical protein
VPSCLSDRVKLRRHHSVMPARMVGERIFVVRVWFWLAKWPRVLIGRPDDKKLRKIQVKSVRSPPWYVSNKSFRGKMLGEITIYVLIGSEDARKPVRYFITKNRDVARKRHKPRKWKDNAFMPRKAVESYEDNWGALQMFVKERA